jgi:hypothetical protein
MRVGAARPIARNATRILPPRIYVSDHVTGTLPAGFIEQRPAGFIAPCLPTKTDKLARLTLLVMPVLDWLE